MDNYEYIIASLPVLTADMRGGIDTEGTLSEIKKGCSAKDNALIGFLMDGWVDERLTQAFYDKAITHSDPFLRGYFAYDLMMRNAKVRYLNKALGRDADQDTLSAPEADAAELGRIEAALATDDILARERALDDLMWAKIAELSLFDYFNIDAILAFIAKLHIIDRWLRLDEESGREMFGRLVTEVRGTFKGVNYTEK